VSGNSGGGEKTEKATPKKRKKARRDGQISNTHEVGSWLGLLAATFVIPSMAHSLLSNGTTTLVQVSAVIRNPDPGRAIGVASSAFSTAIRGVLPIGVLIALTAIVSVAAQGGLVFAPKLLKPKFSRLNPLSGVKRMFGPHGWWALIKSLLKSSALAVVVVISVRQLVPTIIGSGSMDLSTLLDVAGSAVLGMLRYAAVAGLVMAVADWVVVHRRNSKHLKMTKQEIKDEYKSSEGDPHVKGQRRSRQMAMSRNRMMADVPLADVILVNPTHVAVALRYDPAKGAPRVVAKGADHVAARIRELADQHRIPMVADVALARTLYKACKVGQEIPPDLYRAVATVLAFIMTLKRRGSVAGTHSVRALGLTTGAA
jgi:flagellar biosynthetic protein FlhB